LETRPHDDKILIADDEPNIVISLEYLLQREGYTVLVARDGQEALDTIAREQPALVLLDVMMPHKTGFEVCQAVRADEALQGTKILMLTAKGRETDVAKGMALGANAYMTKPFSTRELVQKVAELLGETPHEKDRPPAGAGHRRCGPGDGAVAGADVRDRLVHAGCADERLAVGDVLAPRTVLVAMGWLLGLLLVAVTLHMLHRRYVGARTV
jgi:DNA-binding response OmpR family regulator